jgi:phage protein D
MKTPRAEISVNGKPVASLFNERLISVTIVDKDGVTSDTIDCALNDGNPFAAIPKKGDTMEAAIGYAETGVVGYGSYTVEDPEIQFLPYSMMVKGKGANMRDALKQRRGRHWDQKTVKDIVGQIASENGLSPVIDDEVAGYTYEWFGQQDESDLHVVERLARRHGALFSIKDGKLIFAKKGSGKSVSGKDLTPVIASPANIVQGTGRVSFAHRNKFRKVKARIYDRNKAKQVEIEVDSDEEGTADYTIPEPFGDEGEAKAAAKSKADDLKSETIRTSVTVFGDPSIRAGATLVYSGVRPEIDGVIFIIETATHRIDKGGYTTQIEAKLKPDQTAKTSSTSPAAAAAPSIPAPSAPGIIGR